MKSILLFSLLFITATCDSFGNLEITESPNPNTQQYIEMFGIEMTLTKILEDDYCDVCVWVKNTTEFTLKKIYITYEICNRIGERVIDNKTNKYQNKVSLIGPINPNKGYWTVLENKFYNLHGEYVKIVSVDVEYN